MTAKEKRQARRDAVLAMWMDGLSQAAIAKHLRCGPATVSKDLRVMGAGDMVAERQAMFQAAVDERRARMNALYDGGMTLEQIGGEYNISRERVRQIIGSVRERRKGMTADRRSRAKAMWDDGVSKEDIAKELGCSANTVSSDVRAMGAKPYSELVSERRERARRLFSYGLSYAKVAEVLGVPVHVASNDLRGEHTAKWRGMAKEIAAMRESGIPDADIADTLGVQYGTMIAQVGTRVSARIRVLIAEGMGDDDIASLVGCDVDRVCRERTRIPRRWERKESDHE